MNVINELRVDSGAQPPTAHNSLASVAQLKLLKYHAMACALVYCPLNNFRHFDQETNDEYDGEALRAYIQQKFDDGKGFIPTNIFRHFFVAWINPRTHNMLEEGGYRKYTIKKESFNYSYLKPVEASYLIQRYAAIHEKIFEGSEAKINTNNN